MFIYESSSLQENLFPYIYIHYYLTDSKLIQSQCFFISMSQLRILMTILFEENKYCMSSPGPGKNVIYHFNYHKEATTTVLSLTVGIL